MNKDKFEYFLNAVHYCLWLGDISFGAFAESIDEICTEKLYDRQVVTKRSFHNRLFEYRTDY